MSVVEKNNWNFDEVVEILGEPKDIYSNYFRTECTWRFNQNYALALYFDKDTNFKVGEVDWFDPSWGGTFLLEDIFEKLPQELQNMIIFNLDLFT